MMTKKVMRMMMKYREVTIEHRDEADEEDKVEERRSNSENGLQTIE